MKKLNFYALLFSMVFASASARAEIVTLNSCNFGAICGTSPFAQVDKELTGTTATITLTLFDSLQLINSGFGFNATVPINSTSVTNIKVSLNGSTTETSCTTCSLVTTSHNFDGYGSFSYHIDPQINGNTGGITDLQFQVSGVTSLSQLDVASNQGSEFAAEVGKIGCTTGACTGFIGQGTPSVPEPTSILFFGSGLLIAGCMLRNKLLSSR
jgi:hypothetical protein